MSEKLDDTKVRLAAFEWLKKQVEIHGDKLPRLLLQKGFELDGVRVPLMSRQGIFKPAVLSEIPLSITTTPNSNYDDTMGDKGLMLYSYRGTNLYHVENVGLRKAMLENTPLIYFFGILPGKYIPIWPVFIVGDDQQTLKFSVAVDDRLYLDYTEKMESQDMRVAESEDFGRRTYITGMVKQRLHQRSFRERVLDAYHEQCALCKLRHVELLDAAHIIPDGEDGGDPIVVNGLSLCKLHHAAFDNFFIGIRSDYIIEVRKEVLEEEDGPMLLHGLKGLHKTHLILPKSTRNRPDKKRLEIRYEKFLLKG